MYIFIYIKVWFRQYLEWSKRPKSFLLLNDYVNKMKYKCIYKEMLHFWISILYLGFDIPCLKYWQILRYVNSINTRTMSKLVNIPNLYSDDSRET